MRAVGSGEKYDPDFCAQMHCSGSHEQNAGNRKSFLLVVPIVLYSRFVVCIFFFFYKDTHMNISLHSFLCRRVQLVFTLVQNDLYR